MCVFMKNMKFPLLLDVYAVLLTERKREILDYYYNDDYSLSEIAELTGISRQGIRDSIKKSEEEINEYESKLKIVEKQEEASKLCECALEIAQGLIRDDACDISAQAREMLSLLEHLKSIIGTQPTDTSDIRE